MEIIIVLFIILAVVFYVLFSSPKSTTNPTKREGRNSPIYCSIIKNSYPPVAEVFKTLEDANISPCFLRRYDDE